LFIIKGVSKEPMQMLQDWYISSYQIPDAQGWSVYFLSAKAKVKIDGKEQEAIITQTVFVKGDRITLHLKKKVNRNGKIKSIEYTKILKPKKSQMRRMIMTSNFR